MSPAEVVQRQLDAYNARDVEALLATYAPDATQHALHGGLDTGVSMLYPFKEGALGGEDMLARVQLKKL